MLVEDIAFLETLTLHKALETYSWLALQRVALIPSTRQALA
jgi:hypothetical protein